MEAGKHWMMRPVKKLFHSRHFNNICVVVVAGFDGVSSRVMVPNGYLIDQD